MVRTSTRSGGVHQPSSVSLLVSRSIANVKKCFKAEHAKAKRAQVSAKRTEEEQKRQQRYVEKCAKLRRLDAEVIEKLLERGKCTMRFKMRGAHQLVRNDWASLEDKRESMRGTSWVFCKACDDYGTDAWHNPSKLLSPEELLGGHRHQPCCTHNGARWEGGRVSLTCPELRRVPRKLPRPEYWGSACDVSLVVSPPPPPEVPDADGSLQRVDPSFPKCLRNLCAKLPTPDAALAAAAMVSQASEHVYNQETPLECAQRQKAHSHKDVLAMNDEVFYKHQQFEQNKAVIKRQALELACPLLVADEVARGNYSENDLKCLLRMQMKQVAVAGDGHQYDFVRIKQYIRKHIGQRLVSPVTGEPMIEQVCFTLPIRNRFGNVVYVGTGKEKLPKLETMTWRPPLNPLGSSGPVAKAPKPIGGV